MGEIMVVKVSKDLLMLCSFIISIFILRFSNLEEFYGQLLVAISGIIIFCNLVIKKHLHYLKMIVLLFLMSVFMLISYIFNGNASISNFLWCPCYMGIAWLIYNNKISYRVFDFLFYMISGVFVFCMLLGIDSRNIISYASRNYISVIMLFFLSLSVITRFKQGQSIGYIPILLNMLICFYGQGRAGVFCSIILFVVFFIIESCKNFSLLKITVLVLFLLIGICCMEIHQISFISSFIDRVQTSGLQTTRMDILVEYSTAISNNILYFIFGAPYDIGYWLDLYRNPHNSILCLHMKYGIGGIFLVFGGLSLCFYRYLRKDAVISLFFCIVFLRSLFDWVAFNGVFDVLFWIFCYDGVFGISEYDCKLI